MLKRLFTFIMLLTAFSFMKAQVSSFPYGEDFETFGQCATSCGSACLMSNGWTNVTNDGMDWTADNSGTSSSNTGPTANGGADHNPGVAGGTYLYTETSGSACNNTTAILESPEFQTTNVLPGLNLEFWFHMYGAAMGHMLVEIQTISGGVGGAWTQIDSIGPFNLDQWQQRLIDLSAYVGDTFKIRFVANTGNTFTSDMAIDDVQLYAVYGNSARIASVDRPIGPISPGSQNVEVTIENEGQDTLFTATIEWTVNGVAQTSVPWMGGLANRETEDSVNLGAFNFPAGLHEICAWTILPNGVQDSSTTNDTACVVVCTPLKGNYTLGGATADFADFNELGEVLSLCGVDSHTVVTVNPGTYTGRLILDHVPGTSSMATITIDGGDSSLVTLSNNTFSNVYLDGTDWVTIQNMTLENTGTTDAYGVQLRDTAEHNTIESCHIVMSPATNTSDCIGVSASNSETSSFTEGQNALWTTVSNCRIDGGEKGIHFEGQNALRNVGNSFINNHIVSPEDYGFYMDDQDSITFTANVIEGVRSSFGDGFYCFDLMMFSFVGNQALDVPDYGMYIADGNFDAVPSSRGRIVNNMISSLTDYAIYFDDFEEADIWHNTAYGSPGIRINDFVGLDIRNNIFVSDNDYAFETDENTTLDTLNHNLYWTPASNTNFVKFGTATYANLSAWQTAFSQWNANSVEGDPVFIGGTSDLHLLGIAANDAGDNGVGVTVDIDGDTRPAGTVVDIGADEYTPNTTDAAMVGLLDPPSIACGDSFLAVTLVIRNLGVDTIFSLPITANVSGDVNQSLNFTYSDTLPFNAYDTVVVGTLNMYNGGFIQVDGYVSLPGDQDATNDTLQPGTSHQIISAEPIAYGDTVCDADSMWLSAFPWTGVTYGWFDSDTATVPIAEGDSFLATSVVGRDTFYVQYLTNSDSLETTLQAGNGCGGGNMFDLTASNTINLTGIAFSSNVASGGNATITVHYIPNGTFVNNETNATAWTQHATGTVVSNGSGAGILTRFDFPTPLVIPAGATYAIYVEADVNYTTGSFPASNLDLSFSPGVGLCSSFGSINNPRTFNGRFYYGTTGCSNIRMPVIAQSVTPPSVDLGPDSAYCATSITLDAGNPGSMYSWSTGDTTQTIPVVLSGQYEVVVTDNFGCSNTDTVLIVLNTPPTVDLGGDQASCGDPVVLDAGNFGSLYNWSSGETSQTISVTMAGTYYVEVTDANGCTGSDTVDVVFNTPPTVDLGPDTLLCDGASVNLDAGNPTASYSWSTGETTQSISVSAAGQYIVTVTDTNTCEGMDTVDVATAVTPSADFSFAIDPAGQGYAYDFTDLSTGDPTSWMWNFGDTLGTDSVQNPSYTYAAGGNYTVTLIASNVCGSDTFTQTTMVVSLDDGHIAGGSVEIFPNPNNGQFTLSFSDIHSDKVRIEILNANGQRVVSKNLKVNGNFEQDFNLGQEAQGIYFLHLEIDGARLSRSILVK